MSKGVFRFSLPFYEADDESLLSRIVTGDETWIHHFEQQTKLNGMALPIFSSEATASAGEIMTSVFWWGERMQTE
jgi:hypothetical protein